MSILTTTEQNVFAVTSRMNEPLVEDQDGAPLPPFEEYPKTPRLMRDIIVTEKIDGTNAQVFISESGAILAGSRSRWITPKEDNYGFAKWVESNREELLRLGPGRHFGEWWGAGVQRRYDQPRKRFSLFNVARWSEYFAGAERNEFASRPSCCDVVPVLYSGPFSESGIALSLDTLRRGGSVAAPGFMRPEGIIVFHTAAQKPFKILLENDDKAKGAA